MGAIYIGVILLCRVVQHLYNKKASMMLDKIVSVLRYNGVRQCISAILALGLIFIGGKGFKVDALTATLSISSGIMLALSGCLSLYAMKTGMVALVSLFGTAGMLVPCLAGVFLFDIPIGAMQWLGFLLFMVAAYLMIMGSKKAVSGFSVKTFFLLVGVMIAEGGTMLMQQMFARYVPDGDVSMFSFLSFFIVGVVMLIMAMVIAKGKGEKIQPMPKELKVIGTVLAVVLLIINQLATIASAFVPPVILFTFINGGSTIIAAIVAAAKYKEKLEPKTVIGILLGVTAFVIIKMFE